LTRAGTVIFRVMTSAVDVVGVVVQRPVRVMKPGSGRFSGGGMSYAIASSLPKSSGLTAFRFWEMRNAPRFTMRARFVPDAFSRWRQISLSAVFVSIRQIVASINVRREVTGTTRSPRTDGVVADTHRLVRPGSAHFPRASTHDGLLFFEAIHRVEQHHQRYPDNILRVLIDHRREVRRNSPVSRCCHAPCPRRRGATAFHVPSA
jgi:hypothetical protein